MPAPALTNLQRELLDLFATDLSEDELREVRTLLARHFAEKATAAFDRLADDRGLSADDLGRLAHGHERARTDRPASAGDGA
ncbi:hypothetical protein [Rubrivirga sp. IMCC43871]|uniref:hypothetical protein n=1 Tax=Rubrivirga sp. IMCC43871 TaxID=3391575 RepID=UPI00398FF9D1